jgi:hypothetical protein
MKKIWFGGLLVLGLFTAGAFAASTLANQPPKPPGPGASHEKVTICHATHSDKNPFVEITVNINSIEDAQHLGGHLEHPGDVIPPYTFTDEHGSFSFPGQGNQELLENGCELTEGPPPTNPPPTNPPPTEPPPTNPPPTNPPPTNPPSTETTPSTTTSPTPPEPTTTTQETTQTPPAQQPTPKQLKKELKKQESQPGTGKTTSTTAQSGQLPHTGFKELLAVLLGALMFAGGIAFRLLARI